VNNTIPTSAQIGTALERAARTIAIAIAVTIATVSVTRSALTRLATFATNLTRRPLATLIDLIPSVTPTPAPAPSLLTVLGAELLTDAEMDAEIAQYDARTLRKRPASRRKPAGARKPATVG
jgi:hypothetical protein